MRLEHLPADVLGLSDVARIALSGRPRPERLPGTLVPGRAADFPRPEERLEEEQRVELAGLLEAACTVRETHVAVLDNVRALAQPGTFLLLAGQQPGFLGGPLYDVYKVLHIVRLARELESALGLRIVPGFWNHADDHDVAEVHHLWIQNPNLDLRKIAVPGLSSGRVPLGRIVFDEETHRLEAIGETVRQTLGGLPSDDVEAFLPRAGETFASAFTRLLEDLFGHLGLVVIEPDWIRDPLSRRLAALVTSEVEQGLVESTEALREAGVEPGIALDEAALLFHLEDGRRRALRLAPGGFRFDGESGSRTPSELAAEILQEPGAWSPGALLRPIVQDLTLPVAGYVGGWGELAYHVQLPALRRRAGAPATPFVPRLSATLVDAATDASLQRLGLTLEAFLGGGGALPEEEDEGPEVVARLREVARRTVADLGRLEEEMAELDRGLAAQLGRAGSQVRGAIEKLAQKAERVHANSRGGGRRHARRVQNGLLPRDLPQERVRGALEFVAHHGRAWMDQLLPEIDPFPTEHLVVHLEGVPDDPAPADGGKSR